MVDDHMAPYELWGESRVTSPPHLGAFGTVSVSAEKTPLSKDGNLFLLADQLKGCKKTLSRGKSAIALFSCCAVVQLLEDGFSPE